jgi:hypothetical protein
MAFIKCEDVGSLFPQTGLGISYCKSLNSAISVLKQ